MSIKAKIKKKSPLWTEDYSCPCCDLFWAEWVKQQLKLDGNDADAVYQDLREVMREGFARYAYPLLGRLIQLEPGSRRVERMSQLRIDQLNAVSRSLDKMPDEPIGSLP